MSNRLVLLGDSILKGVMFNAERNRYTMYDDTAFIEKASGRGMEVVKHCRMGATVDYGIDALGMIREGDTVMIELGGNDSNYDWQKVAADPDAEHLPNTEPGKFRRMYVRMIDSIRSIGAEPVVVNLTPIDSESFFNWISVRADGASVLKWLGDKNMLYRWHEYYNGMVEDAARVCGARLIDLRDELLKTRTFHTLLSEDGLHPNERGHNLIRNVLLSATCSD